MKYKNKKKLAWGGSIDPSLAAKYGNIGTGMQMGSQAINMIDGMDSKPSTFGGVTSGALSGASMGMALGPIGAAAGAVIGGGTALIASEAQKKKEKEAQELYMKNLGDQAKMQSEQTLRNYASQGITSNGSYAYGGNITPEYEVESGEVIQGNNVNLDAQQQIASDITKVPDYAPSHAEGGVEGSGGDRVYSDRLKGENGKTYAQTATDLGKQKGKYESKMSSMNETTKNTGQRMTERIDKQLDDLFNEQEMKKYASMPSSFSSSQPKFAGGGKTPKRFLDQNGNPIGDDVVIDPEQQLSYNADIMRGIDRDARIDGIYEGNFLATNGVGSREDFYKKYPTEEAFNNRFARTRPELYATGGNLPKLAGGYNLKQDPNKIKGFGVNPNPVGWGLDDRSGRPTNDMNRNTMYSQATDAFNNGTFLQPGQTDAYGNTNVYPNTVMSNQRGSMYNRTLEDYIKPQVPATGGQFDLTGLDGIPNEVDRNTYAKPDMSVTATTNDGTGNKVKLPNQNGIPWQYVDNLANGIATANTPQIAKPYLDPAIRLNTNFDINPQLSSARNTRDALNKSIDSNTVQSGVANANKQKLFSSYTENANNLYAQKHNVENALKNQEISVNSGINSRNNDKRYAYDVENTKRTAGIQEDYVNNARNFERDQYTSARDTKKDAIDLENIKQIAMANANGANYGYNLKAYSDMYGSDPTKLDADIARLTKDSPNSEALKYLIKMKQGLNK